MPDQLYLFGIALSLSDKVQKSIATIQLYEPKALERDPVNGYYVADSYGKDSCVIRHLCAAAGVAHKCHHHLTTLDPPELIHFGRKHHPDALIHRPSLPLLARFVQKSAGPPTRRSRWCCQEYKEPYGNPYIKVLGIRAQESRNRKVRWKIWTPWKRPVTWILNPILYWTAADVWEYIRQHKIPYCCLYDQGFSRLGCVGCPMSGNGRYKEFARWPKYEKLWHKAFQKYWLAWHNVPRKDGDPRWFDKKGWTSWQDLWKWWMEETPRNAPDDCQPSLF